MADAAEQRFLTRVEVITGLAEPLSVIILGLLVGTVVISIYQTVFQLIPLVN